MMSIMSCTDDSNQHSHNNSSSSLKNNNNNNNVKNECNNNNGLNNNNDNKSSSSLSSASSSSSSSSSSLTNLKTKSVVNNEPEQTPSHTSDQIVNHLTNNNVEDHENQNILQNCQSENTDANPGTNAVDKPTVSEAKSTSSSPITTTTAKPSEQPVLHSGGTRPDDETVYDNSGVDTFEFIKKTLLENPNDRLFMLSIEKYLINFLNDDKHQYYKFQPMNTYHRMLVHRIGAYFCLGHNVDPQTKQCVIVNKTEKSRIPSLTFQMCIPADETTDDQQKKLANSATSSTNNLNGTCNIDGTSESKTKQPNESASTGIANNSTVIKKQILRRENNEQDNLKQNRYNRTTPSEIKPKTFEEKSADYIKAKNRIFNSNNGTSSSNYNNSTCSIQVTQTKAIYTNNKSQQINSNENASSKQQAGTLNSNKPTITSSFSSNSNGKSQTNTNSNNNNKQQQQQYTILNRTNQPPKKILKNGKPVNQTNNYTVSNSSSLASIGYQTNQNKMNLMSNSNNEIRKPPQVHSQTQQQQQQSSIKLPLPLAHQHMQLAQTSISNVSLHYQQQQSLNQNLQANSATQQQTPMPSLSQPPQPTSQLQAPSTTPSQTLQQAPQAPQHPFMQYPAPVYSPTSFANQIDHNMHDMQYHLQYINLNAENNNLQYYNPVQPQNPQMPFYVQQTMPYVQYIPYVNTQPTNPNPSQQQQQQQPAQQGPSPYVNLASANNMATSSSNNVTNPVLYKSDPSHLYVNTVQNAQTMSLVNINQQQANEQTYNNSMQHTNANPNSNQQLPQYNQVNTPQQEQQQQQQQQKFMYSKSSNCIANNNSSVNMPNTPSISGQNKNPFNSNNKMLNCLNNNNNSTNNMQLNSMTSTTQQQSHFSLPSPTNGLNNVYQIMNTNSQLYQAQQQQHIYSNNTNNTATNSSYQQANPNLPNNTQYKYNPNQAMTNGTNGPNQSSQQVYPGMNVQSTIIPTNGSNDATIRSNPTRQSNNRMQHQHQSYTSNHGFQPVNMSQQPNAYKNNVFNAYNPTNAYTANQQAIASAAYVQQQNQHQQNQKQQQHTQHQHYTQQYNNYSNSNNSNNSNTSKFNKFKTKTYNNNNNTNNNYNLNKNQNMYRYKANQSTTKSTSVSPPKLLNDKPNDMTTDTTTGNKDLFLQMHDFKAGLNRTDLNKKLLDNNNISEIGYYERTTTNQFIKLNDVSHDDDLSLLNNNENVFVLLKFHDIDCLNSFYNLFNDREIPNEQTTKSEQQLDDHADVAYNKVDASSPDNVDNIKTFFKLRHFNLNECCL